MGELQWALLIVCVVLVVLLYLFSRRKRDDGPGRESPDLAPPVTDAGQSDLFTAPPPRAPGPAPEGFDEFGVGNKRVRGAPPTIDPSVQPRMPPPSTMNIPMPPKPAPAGSAPNPGPSAGPPATPAPAPAKPAAPAAGSGDGKLVVLIVAPTEETDILGPQLHSALAAQGLKFGEGEVYHRLIGGKIVYSVAGLIKPGKLIPAEAAGFSTRGLTVLLQLPGPVVGDVAFDDMAATTRALATALKAEVFDMRRQRLTDDVAATLRTEVSDWVRASKS